MGKAHTVDSRLTALDALARMTIVRMTKGKAPKTGVLHAVPNGKGGARNVITTIAAQGATIYAPHTFDSSKPLTLIYAPKGTAMANAAMRQANWAALLSPESVAG